MIALTQHIWSLVLRFAPTCSLQEAMMGRAGVDAKFVYPGEALDLSVSGVCWVTINHD